MACAVNAATIRGVVACAVIAAILQDVRYALQRAVDAGGAGDGRLTARAQQGACASRQARQRSEDRWVWPWAGGSAATASGGRLVRIVARARRFRGPLAGGGAVSSGGRGWSRRSLLRQRLLAVAELGLARAEAPAAAAAEGGAGAEVDASVAAVEAVGPAPAAGALLGGVVSGVGGAALEAGEGRDAKLGQAVAPADGAPVSVVRPRGADALAAALDAAAEAAVLFHSALAVPVLFGQAIGFWLATAALRRLNGLCQIAFRCEDLRRCWPIGCFRECFARSLA